MILGDISADRGGSFFQAYPESHSWLCVIRIHLKESKSASCEFTSAL